MAQVFFTTRLKALVPKQPVEAPGGTVREVLDRVFRDHPQLRHYIVDEQGVLRRHVCVFADGDRLAGDGALKHAIGPQTELYVMQALSGG